MTSNFYSTDMVEEDGFAEELVKDLKFNFSSNELWCGVQFQNRSPLVFLVRNINSQDCILTFVESVFQQ